MCMDADPMPTLEVHALFLLLNPGLKYHLGNGQQGDAMLPKFGQIGCGIGPKVNSSLKGFAEACIQQTVGSWEHAS